MFKALITMAKKALKKDEEVVEEVEVEVEATVVDVRDEDFLRRHTGARADVIYG